MAAFLLCLNTNSFYTSHTWISTNSAKLFTHTHSTTLALHFLTILCTELFDFPRYSGHRVRSDVHASVLHAAVLDTWEGGGSLSPTLRTFTILSLGLSSGSLPLSQELSSPVVSSLPLLSFCFFLGLGSGIPWQPLVPPWSLECLEPQAPPFSWSRQGRPPFLFIFLYLRVALSLCSSLRWSARPPRSPPLVPLRVLPLSRRHQKRGPNFSPSLLR